MSCFHPLLIQDPKPVATLFIHKVGTATNLFKLARCNEQRSEISLKVVYMGGSAENAPRLSYCARASHTSDAGPKKASACEQERDEIVIKKKCYKKR